MPLHQAKAKEMLRHGSVRGQALSKKQKGLFGLIAGGKRPTKKSPAEEAVKKASK